MTGADLIDRADIVAVGNALGAGELRNRRWRAWWRDGSGWNVSIDPERNVWRDHVSGAGGGVLDLIQAVLACSRRRAFEWLAAHMGVELDGTPANKVDRRRLAREAARTRRERERAGHWRRGRMAGLEALKAEAGDCGKSDTLAAAAGELLELQRAAGPALVDLWRAAVKADPEGAADCERWGREDEAHAIDTAAVVVTLLEAATEATA